MAIARGSTPITNIRRGTTPIVKVMRGAVEIWPLIPPINVAWQGSSVFSIKVDPEPFMYWSYDEVRLHLFNTGNFSVVRYHSAINYNYLTIGTGTWIQPTAAGAGNNYEARIALVSAFQNGGYPGSLTYQVPSPSQYYPLSGTDPLASDAALSCYVRIYNSRTVGSSNDNYTNEWGVLNVRIHIRAKGTTTDIFTKDVALQLSAT